MASDPMSPSDLMLDLVTAQHKMIMSLLDKNEALLASCVEFLPILERQLASVNPGGIADDSKAVQCANARVERMRAAIAKATGAAP